MGIDVLAVLAAKYEGRSLQVRKKSRILAVLAFGFGALSLLFAGLMAATKAPVAAAVFVAIALFCAAVIALLRAGKYDIASSAFLYGLFAAMFVAIKFDQYQDVYEAYVFGTLGCFLLVAATLIADRPSQAVAIGALDLAAIQALYWLDAFPKDGKVVTTLAIQNLAVSSLMVALSAFVAAYLVRMTSGLIGEVERDAQAAERSYGDLNAAMGEAQSTSQRVGESLSASVTRTTESIASLLARVEGISSGMDELDSALRLSGEANRRSEAGQGEVKAALSAYSDQVARASAAIEEMAAAASALAAQASGKKEAVRELVETSTAGEGIVASMGASMESINEAARRIAELGAIIGDVADRTNLLGMNASIEAAHAGAAGRGFAVVANEIRALSIEASKSARVIGETLKETQASIESTSRRSSEVREAFKLITENVRGVSLMIEELLASVQELSSGSADVVSAVEAVADLTRSTEVAVERSCEGMEESLRGMEAVARIAARVRADTGEMSSGFDEMRRDSGEVSKLGAENLGSIQGLRSKLDHFSRDRQNAEGKSPGRGSSRGIRIKRPAR
jgi:methyl-accepting chemotaxis protein